MISDTHSFLNKFSEINLLVILETFNIALRDAEFYDSIAESLDISDDELMKLRDNVQEFLNSDI